MKNFCLKRLLLCILFAFGAAGCSPIQECITAIDNGNTFGKKTFFIDAGDPNPVLVPAGDRYSYEVKGDIMMGCRSDDIYVSVCTEPGNNCKDEPNKFFMTNDAWKDVNLPLADGDVLVVRSVTGSWSVRESQGNRDCLLAAGVGDQNKCLAENGQGLFVETQSGDPFELTAGVQSGKQAQFIQATDLKGTGAGGKNFRLRFMHKKNASTEETGPADPTNAKYLYEPGGYRLAVSFCKKKLNDFHDGKCLQTMKTKDGVAFYFDDAPGKDCNGDGDYNNNFGSYEVTIVNGQGKSDQGFQKFLSNIVTAYKAFLFGKGNGGTGGVVDAIYKGLTGQETFLKVVRASMALSIIFIGIGYVGGMIRMNWEGFVKLCFKYAVVMALVSENGWNIVYTYLGVNFTSGMDGMLMGIANIFREMVEGTQLPTVAFAKSQYLHDYATAGHEGVDALLNPAEKWQTVFEVANLPLSLMGNRNVWIKLSALLLSFPVGTFYFFVILIGVVMYFFALAKTVFNYMITLTLAAVMFTLLPIAAIFWMFGKTKFVFESVLNQLLTFFLQILLTMTFLMFFSIVIYAVMYAMMMFTVCFGCAMMIDFGLSEMLLNRFGDFDIVCIIWGYLPWGAGPMNDIWYRIGNFPVPIFRVGAFLVSVYMFQNTIDWITDLARRFGDAFDTSFSQVQLTNQAAGQVTSQPLRLARHTGGFVKHSGKEGFKTARQGIRTIKKMDV
ncbi:MAG: hypothetical protein ABW189_02105 [Rickettsiales bacterium]